MVYKVMMISLLVLSACAAGARQLRSEYRLIGDQASINRELKNTCHGYGRTVTWSHDKTEARVVCAN
jgi:hypothetical protein